MLEDLQNQINEIFSGSNLERLTFLKNGKIRVKFDYEKAYILNNILELMEIIEQDKK